MEINKTAEEKQKDHETSSLNIDTKQAIVGGVIATGVILLGAFAINLGSGSDARLLLEGMMPSVRFLCSAIMTASATILALMLTMLSMSSSKETTFNGDYYRRVRQIALVDTAVFIGAIFALLFISIPVSESNEVPANWFSIFYYLTLAIATILGGALIAIVIMLYNAINGMIKVVHPQQESQWTQGE